MGQKQKIGIIGAGWYGCHLALALKKAGHDVVLYEKNPRIFSQISGEFGVRLHAGPHYPRSAATRKSCRRGFTKFKQTYPDLVVPHEYSIYALGAKDADGLPSRADASHFKTVCEESEGCREIDPAEFGYKDMLSAYDVDEPSIALGERLRSKFTEYLAAAGVEVHCNYEVNNIESEENGTVTLSNGTSSDAFDKVINATSYQAHVPLNTYFPFDMDVAYQPCLSLIYKDKTPGQRPFSFIVMDGWFPCLAPSTDEKDPNDGTPSSRTYFLTHSKWTIMGSYHSAAEGKEILGKLDNSFIEEAIKPFSENEMNRFWPGFADRFEYIGWKGEVLAKLKTKREFRSAVTYEKDNVIHIVPGKISNIFEAETEVFALLNNENILSANGYYYMQGGVLDEAYAEITEKPTQNEASTVNLKTYDQLTRSPSPASPVLSHQNSNALPSRQSSTGPENIIPTNYSFILKCIAGIIAFTALIAVAILAYSITGAIGSAVIGTAAVVGVGYCGYRLFSNLRSHTARVQDIEQRMPLTSSMNTVNGCI